MNVPCLAARHQRLRGNVVWLSAGAGQFCSGHRAQIIARRLDRELTSDCADIGPVMYPDRTSFRDRPFPAGAASHEIIEPKMTELMPAVGGKDHIAERRGGDQHAQQFEPADEPAAAL